MANNLKKLVMGESEFLITPDWDSIQESPISRLTEEKIDTKTEETKIENIGIKVTGAIEFQRKGENPYRIPRIFIVEELPNESEYGNYQIGDIFILIEKTTTASSEEGET